ncbi:Translocase of chloroplast 120 [Morus notabilis]|uniref:Translocase of chloroplast 120 n=1 Tax=Morus notabilis TaxID=981085 RepID=W9QKE7_9ROSA|nr:translocase of chloroplast 120, chloroplastic [Morus notabilis]EXB39274.1 Translocase of chloroplast 120 [Morus notabilis]
MENRNEIVAESRIPEENIVEVGVSEERVEEKAVLRSDGLGLDNWTEMVAESRLLEEKIVEVGVSEERVEEKAVVGSDGLNEPEAEEVFEEAMDTQEHLDEQGKKADLGDRNEEENAKMVSAEGSSVVEEVPIAGDEVENFEEAIGVPGEVGEHEDWVGDEEEEVISAEEKARDFTWGNNVEEAAVAGGIDEGGTKMEDATNDVNGLGDDGLVGTSEDGLKVISEIVVGSEIQSTNAVDEVKENSRIVTEDEKTEIDDAGNVNQEKAVAGEDFGNGAASLDSHQETESSKETSTEADNVQVLHENILVAEDRNGNIINESDRPSMEFHDDQGVKPAEEAMDSEHQEPDSSGPKYGTTSADSIHNDDSAEPQNSYIDTEQKSYRNGEAEDSSAGLPSEHSGETSELKSSLDGTQSSTQDKAVTSEEVVSMPFSENSTIEKTEVIQASATDLRTESSKASQPEQVRDVHVVYDNGTAKEPEKKEEKRSTQMNRPHDKPTQGQPSLPAGQPSLPARPINPATSPARPAGLGRAAPLLEPAPRVVQQPRVNGTVSHTQNQQIDEPVNGDSEDYEETREKLQMIRVKFLRLAHRLGQTPHNVVVAQVLYRLGLAEQLRGRNGGRVGAFSFDRASAMAEQLEASGQEPLDFSCTIMVLGKTGVGKSATINSIFDEVKFGTDAFQTGTKKVQDVVGTVQGIKVRVIDTPGLLPSWSDQRKNEKILLSVKRFIKKTPPDIVLYLDRLDMQSRDFSDMPLLRTITEIFGPSIWCNAIVVLTHAASAPPEGPSGVPSSYDMFVTQRSHVVQQAIRQAAADMRLMNPVSLVENHSACRINRAGQRVLPNGQVWKPHLLLLSFASKILAEANALLKLQDSPPGKNFATRSRAPPLPFLLSSLLQSRPELRLPEEQYGDDDDLDDDLDESSDSDNESELEELPPFKRLSKVQVAKLSKAQKNAYFDELEYREKLLMKKQLKEEKKRRKMMKQMAASVKDLPNEYGDNTEEESTGAASVPVAMPDLVLPASFDSDNPTHRYRYLDSSNQWLVRPVLETHGWDHDVGYEGINVERIFAVKNKIPLSFTGQVSKDKKDAHLQMEVASSIKHGEGKATSLGFDMQTVGKDISYTLRSETRFSNFRKNKATAGISVTVLGDSLSAGVKVEDKLIANKRFQVVMTGGAMTGRGDVAYGGSLEAQLRDKDYPLGRSLSTLGFSVMDWHGDLAIGCNIQSQIPVGRHTNLVARANLNNRGAGQVSIRLNSSEQLQLALTALVPILRWLLAYPQQLQFGQ